MAIDRPETNAGAPPFAGAGQHRRNFLGARGMAANPGSPCGLPHGVGPSGEESCDDAVALKRSKRPALVFGQIRPLKRPFGAVETQGLNGDVATLRLHQDDQTRHTGHMSPCVQAVRILLPGPFHWHCLNRFPVQSANAGADRHIPFGLRPLASRQSGLVAIPCPRTDEDCRRSISTPGPARVPSAGQVAVRRRGTVTLKIGRRQLSGHYCRCCGGDQYLLWVRLNLQLPECCRRHQPCWRLSGGLVCTTHGRSALR
jgi:hypothetical protein